MKVISYSLFNYHAFTDTNRFEFMAMLRGAYWNFRMNRMIYPGWTTAIHTDTETYQSFQKYFEQLQSLGASVMCVSSNPAISVGMLWRLLPLWEVGVTHVLCRDSDALTTYREAQAVTEWLSTTGYPIHAILDNPMHAGLMGGMIGLTSALVQDNPSFEQVISNEALTDRGRDQDILNKKFSHYPILWHRGSADVYSALADVEPPGVKASLWESNLTCRHIGSAGVVEMETIRFFNRFDPSDQFTAFEKQFPNVFYWHG